MSCAIMLHAFYLATSNTKRLLRNSRRQKVITVPSFLSGPQITGFPLYPDYKSCSQFFCQESDIMHGWVKYLRF